MKYVYLRRYPLSSIKKLYLVRRKKTDLFISHQGCSLSSHISYPAPSGRLAEAPWEPNVKTLRDPLRHFRSPFSAKFVRHCVLCVQIYWSHYLLGGETHRHALPRHQTKKWKKKSSNGIEPTTCRIYNQTLMCLCHTTCFMIIVNLFLFLRRQWQWHFWQAKRGVKLHHQLL